MSSRVWARSAPRRWPAAWAGAMSGSRVRATSRAARVSPAIGRMARRATSRPPRKASSVPPRTPKREEQAHAVDRAVEARLGLGVLDVGDAPRRPVAASVAEGLGGGGGAVTSVARDHAVAPMSMTPLDPGGPSGGSAPVAGRPPRRRADDHATIASPAATPRAPIAVALGAGRRPSMRGVDLVLRARRGGAQVVVEAGRDALLGDRADHDREQAQDHEGERGA